MPVLRLITSAAQKGHERFIRTLVAAEEIPQDYQFSAFTASVCCIAMRRRERGLLWVMGRPRKSLAGTASLRPLNPQLHTSAWRSGQLSALCHFETLVVDAAYRVKRQKADIPYRCQHGA